VELCDWMIGEGVTVRVHDPMVKELPQHWTGVVRRCTDPVAAVQGADALVVATEWPVYRTAGIAQLTQASNHLVVLDANRFLPDLAAAASPGLRYFAVGMPHARG